MKAEEIYTPKPTEVIEYSVEVWSELGWKRQGGYEDSDWGLRQAKSYADFLASRGYTVKVLRGLKNPGDLVYTESSE